MIEAKSKLNRFSGKIENIKNTTLLLDGVLQLTVQEMTGGLNYTSHTLLSMIQVIDSFGAKTWDLRAVTATVSMPIALSTL